MSASSSSSRSNFCFDDAQLLALLSLTCYNLLTSMSASSSSSTIWTNSIRSANRYERCTYVIVIGINKYKSPETTSNLGFEDLKGACHDAKCLVRAFRHCGRISQRKLVVQSLLNASAEQIRKTVKKTVGRLTQDSVLMVFFSGHAMQVEDRWTYIVPAHPQRYEDCIPLESFLQECVEERNLKYVHVCCFFLSCRHYEDPVHFPDATMVELEETNSYICVYVCREGEGLTDWCHAAKALSFLLYTGVCELGPLLTKFKEESEFLSLGSVAVNWVPDEIRQTVELFTVPLVERRPCLYQPIMERSQMDRIIEKAPLLRLTLNELSNQQLENDAMNPEFEASAVQRVRRSLGNIASLVERLGEEMRFEPIVSDIRFFLGDPPFRSLKDIEEKLEMLRRNGRREQPGEGCKIPLEVLRAFRRATKSVRPNDLECWREKIQQLLQDISHFYAPVLDATGRAEAAKLLMVMVMFWCVGSSFPHPVSLAMTFPWHFPYNLSYSIWDLFRKRCCISVLWRQGVTTGCCCCCCCCRWWVGAWNKVLRWPSVTH